MAGRDISIELGLCFIAFYFYFFLLICLTDQVIFMLNELDPESPVGKRGNIVRLESNNLLLLVIMRTKIALA